MLPSRPAPRDSSGGDSVVARFKPTHGTVLGWLSLLVVVGVLAWIGLNARTLTGARVALGAVFAAVVVWSTMLRPRAHATPTTLVLRNSVLDSHVPLRLIDDVLVRQTLNVWVGDQRHVCTGIGRSRRSMLKPKRGAASVLGIEQADVRMGLGGPGGPGAIGTSGSYEDFVATRIEALARDAKAAARGSDEPAQVRRVPAWPEIAALVVTGTAFVVSLLL